ncbi:hypothetical protein ACFW34_35175 [Streptomyces sp. NPDC058848]|uniref:hypothetical protein n=1 Tax=Streptomyces sp. NPDC058848 TaxID=3346650 RepID=UPI0036A4F67B
MAETATKEKAGTDPQAPHGRADDGTPLAPYGLKTDGTPRLSNRGRTAKKTQPGPSATKGRSAGAQKAREQRDGLVQLADALLSPAMAATSSPAFAKKVGEQRAQGLAGSLVIVDGFVPAYADWIVQLSQTKPGMLAWMDRMEDNAPYLQGAIITAQLVKAVAGQMMRPDPRLAEAARLKATIRNQQMAAAIEQEAAAMGISLQPEPEPAHGRATDNPFDHEGRPAGMPV